jgi:hypothetical protein
MQKRRQFIKTSALLTTGAIAIPNINFGRAKEELIIGHGDFKYSVDPLWGALSPSKIPVKDCHEMVQDSQGRIVLLTNHTKNNIIIYDKGGNFLESWGTDYPGAHGLTLSNEGGTDYLYISDNARHEVIKTTLDGRVVMTLPWPKETGLYEKAEQYIPTETTIAPNGDIYVADGYGQQYILKYNSNGELLDWFGGRGEGDEYFDNAHGICLDTRKGYENSLLITSRARNQVKRFSLDGELLEVINLPGAFICRPVIAGDEVYFATLISKLPYDSQSGFVTILNKDNQVTSVPGGGAPIYKNGSLERLYQTEPLFRHPHDVCVDDEGSVYVAQWNSGQTYPIKLTRV